MACSYSWGEVLADRLAGDETSARRKGLDTHVEHCAACRTELRELEAIASALRRWGRATLDMATGETQDVKHGGAEWH